MDTWLVALIATNFAFTAFILWLIAYYRLRKSQQKSEERLRVLEALGTGQDLPQFLGSEQGKELLELFASRPAHPLTIVIGTAAFGVVVLFVGLAFLGCAWLEVWNDAETFLVPGLLCGLGGLGVLLAAVVSTQLTRRWGLIPSERKES